MVTRRSLLRGLLALPLAPLAAKLLPKAPALPIVEALGDRFIGLDMAMGSDQTSIWLVEWDNGRVRTSGDLVMQRMADELESRFFYDDCPVVPLVYPQLSVREKIRRATSRAVGGRS